MQQNEEKVKQNIVTDNVSMFENAMKTVPVASRTAKEILDGIKNGLWAGSVRAARAAVNDPEEYSRRKKRLSAVAFAGTFSKRNAQGLASTMMILSESKRKQRAISMYGFAFEVRAIRD
jgi:hypothetical protein